MAEPFHLPEEEPTDARQNGGPREDAGHRDDAAFDKAAFEGAAFEGAAFEEAALEEAAFDEASGIGLPPHRAAALSELSDRIGHRFSDLSLLDRALVHASTGNDGLQSYERLEFLGDSVLGFLVSDHLYDARPESVTEGQLTEQRSRIVSRAPLAEIARQLRLMEHLRIGRGMRNRDLESRRIHADLVEAVLGAVYLDGGIGAARAFVDQHVLHSRARHTAAAPLDPKSRLQHFTQSRGLGTPEYTLVSEEGPAHALHFTFSCSVAGAVYGTGHGPTKRKAQFEAAAEAYDSLMADEERGDGPWSAGPDDGTDEGTPPPASADGGADESSDPPPA